MMRVGGRRLFASFSFSKLKPGDVEEPKQFVVNRQLATSLAKMAVIQSATAVAAFALLAALAFGAKESAGPTLSELQLSLISRIAEAKDPASLRVALEQGLSSASGDSLAALPPSLSSSSSAEPAPIAVIGAGLSGLVASLRLLELGQRVVLIDKSNFFGGNSAKASSAPSAHMPP